MRAWPTVLFGTALVLECVLWGFVGAAAFALFTTGEWWLVVMGAACGAAAPGLGMVKWWRM